MTESKIATVCRSIGLALPSIRIRRAKPREVSIDIIAAGRTRNVHFTTSYPITDDELRHEVCCALGIINGRDRLDLVR